MEKLGEKKNCSGKAKEQAKEQKLQRKSQGTKNYSRMAMYRTVIFSIISSQAEFDQEGVGVCCFFIVLLLLLFLFLN